MDSLYLHKPWPSDVTLVPNFFLDQYMPRANGEFVKIYLYLLRSTQGGLPSLSALADQLNCTERDILRAIGYWAQEGLLNLGFDGNQNLTDISFVNPERSPLAPARAPEPKRKPEPRIEIEPESDSESGLDLEPEIDLAPEIPDLPPEIDLEPGPDSVPEINPGPEPEEDVLEEAAAAQDPPGDGEEAPPDNSLSNEKINELKENDDIIQLLYIAEQYLNRTLSVTDTNKILYFYEELKFNVELIEFLIENCVSRNHTSIHYIEQVAFSWAKQGISTVEAAKEEASLYSKTYFMIFKALGFQNRNPVKAEKEFMDRWMQEWGFSMDLILEACSRTILQTGTGNLRYVNKILSEWHDKDVHHMSDLGPIDADHNRKKRQSASHRTIRPNQFSDYPHRDYDFDKIKKSMFS